MASPPGKTTYDQGGDFWDKYLKGRPLIPQSLFDFVYDYHSRHDGSFDKVHEVGAGVGVYSHRLAARFNHVLVSDVVARNVEYAKTRLQGDQYSFKTTSLEDSISLPANSIDLVFASTMMHFTQVDEAIKAVHHQLKPGGTFAAGLWGTYALHDPKAQAIWAKIVLLTCEWIVNTYRVDGRTDHVLPNEGSGLDSVGLPSELFYPAERYDYNFPEKDTMWDMIVPKNLSAKRINRVGPDDVVKRGWAPDWNDSHDIDGLKGIVDSWPHDKNDPELIALWDELHRIIGVGQVEGAWMVCLLLATKR